jgi:hypothetical protein
VNSADTSLLSAWNPARCFYGSVHLTALQNISATSTAFQFSSSVADDARSPSAQGRRTRTLGRRRLDHRLGAGARLLDDVSSWRVASEAGFKELGLGFCAPPEFP